MSRYSDQTTYDLAGVQVPLPGVVVYVYSSDTAQLATLTADGGGALANPLTSDGNGNYYFNAASGLYDLRYLVGGKTVLWKYGVAVGGYSLAYRAIAQDVVNTTVLNVTSATGQTVSTRGLLAGISSPVNGQRAYLTEAGREGWFQFSTANLSTNVTADPYQGLYVPPSTATTGASGAWVREIKNGEYQTNWWAPEALGNNAHLALNTIDGLLPSTGCRVVFSAIYDTSLRTLFTKNNIEIVAFSRHKGGLRANTSAANFHVLWSAGSGCKILGLYVSGKETSLFSGNPSCIIIQNQYGLGGPAGTLAQRLTQDVEVADCFIENTSLGITLAESVDTDPARNNGVINVPSRDIHAHHNIIYTNMHGFEVFCSDYFDAHDNWIYNSPNAAAAQFSGCFRILGSQEVDVHDNHLQGHGYGRQDQAIFYLSAADAAVGARRANKNLRIRNNDCYNALTWCFAEEAAESTLFEGNHWKESRSANLQTTVLWISLAGITDGLLPVADRVYLRGNTFEGVAQYIIYATSGGGTKHIQSRDNTVIGNAYAPAATGRIYSAVFPGAKLTEFIRDTFLMNDASGYEFLFKNAGSGGSALKLRVVGCTLPEQTTTNSLFDNDGTGTLIKTLGNSGEDATNGSNNRYAVGTFALTL